MTPFTDQLPPNWNPNDWSTRYVAFLPANPDYLDPYSRQGVLRSAALAELSKFLAWRTDRKEPWVWAPAAEVEALLMRAISDDASRSERDSTNDDASRHERDAKLCALIAYARDALEDAKKQLEQTADYLRP
jgi:hypothetical protein